MIKICSPCHADLLGEMASVEVGHAVFGIDICVTCKKRGICILMCRCFDNPPSKEEESLE